MKKALFYIAIISFSLLFTDCAKMGSLTGGPRDTEPPRVIESVPENYSVNFAGQNIQIEFDEFIVLNNINQELIISPPPLEIPSVRLRGKSILIDLNNELKDSTTYTLNFGQAIEDLNEGNPLPNYEFVFSTGDKLDSLSVYGRILNAFNLKPPEEPVNVMLYDQLYDSVVYKEIPVYTGKIDKEGYFRLNNLRADTFKLFALKDLNYNLLFDLPNEPIAFLDSALFLTPEHFTRINEQDVLPDSLRNDSLNQPARDTIIQNALDTLTIEEKTSLFDKIFVDLLLFTEDHGQQYLKDNQREESNHIEIYFNLPVTDSFKINPIRPETNEWYLLQESTERDSFNLWITDSSVIKMDTIVMELQYLAEDSAKNQILKTDTLNFLYRETKKKSGKESEDEDEKKYKLEISPVPGKSIIELNTKYFFKSATPLSKIDSSAINFIKMADTVEVKASYDIFIDSINIMRARFIHNWEENTSYHLTAYPGAFIDIYDQANDTLDRKFKTRPLDYYGKLLVNITNVDCPVIVQLMDNSENILRTGHLDEDGIVEFDFLKPSNYKLKFIHDRNKNEEWDTGNYLEGIQPERVEYYEGEIEVKGNWDIQINKVLEK